MRVDPPFLQSQVVPICLFEDLASSMFCHSLIGTAVFISSTGYFLTARHVADQAFTLATNRAQHVGLVVKAPMDGIFKNAIAVIDQCEPAPSPFDVAIGRVSVSTPTFFRLEHFDIGVWKDVATYGYPTSAIGGAPEDFRINLRANKGYIQRLTDPADMKIGNHPNGFELSFNVSPGMSGSPIFIHRGDNDLLIGIAVSSFRGETVEAEVVEVLEDGTVFKESRVRIEEFGFAHDIRGLLDWRPTMANGMSLLDISRLDGNS